LEAWARVFLDGSGLRRKVDENSPIYVDNPPEVKALPTGSGSNGVTLRDLAQEVLEDGIGRTGQRILWEAKMRTGLAALCSRAHEEAVDGDPDVSRFGPLFSDPQAVAECIRERTSKADLQRLYSLASEAARGRILCFGRWKADYGNPIDWQRDPINGNRWPADRHWSRTLAAEGQVGDVKITWEIARFPQAYLLARAAAFEPASVEEFSDSLIAQIKSFIVENPVGLGVHWSSGQEIVLRQVAWLFGVGVFARLGQSPGDLAKLLHRHAFQCAAHIERNLQYARNFIYNNHLLSEALGLYLTKVVLPMSARQRSWTHLGKCLLEQEADRQIYEDGGYIQQSHNYQRVAMQVYLLASMVARATSEKVPVVWLRAMERSLDFLLAHQNPVDGQLPNYGSNDGALPCILSCCDFSDFRPTLQTLSITTRGERIYEQGPWDEEACWMLGPQALDAPLRRLDRHSVSFAYSGHHVLRGNDCRNFGAFRCGSLRDRFSQIDMLNLDVWWRGHNVLTDGGSYLYNGPKKWHSHFMSTGSHNTLQVDGHDQMVHFRRFKVIHRTRAKLLHFQDTDDWVLCSGEHYGYERLPGKCVHRRTVLFLKDDLWIVVDRVQGRGTHKVRVHWLGGNFSYAMNGGTALRLDTPEGPFYIAVFDSLGRPLLGDVVAGQPDPPRGWLSRYYGEKIPVVSLAAEVSQDLPLTLVSILGAHPPSVAVADAAWRITAGPRIAEFELSASGMMRPPRITPALIT
jgi:asparagine synthase (glutamine-hydrolysing)